MRFWDSSALVPLILQENETETMRAVMATDSQLLVWVTTGVELASAIWRRSRGGELSEPARTAALTALTELEGAWNTAVDIVQIAARARRILATHPLRAADACQLAAALHLCRERPGTIEFVTLDDRLAEAARKEGFRVLPTP